MIPERLKNHDFRFIKLRQHDKIPVEKAWQSKKNYCFDDPALVEWIEQGGNCGIVGGYGGLLVVDFDDLSVYENVVLKLPETFTVKTGSGKYHLYYLCDDFAGTKFGKIDLQGAGKQAVIPGSIHPNGTIYTVFKDVPIASIKRAFLDESLGLKVEVNSVKVQDKPIDDTDSGKEYGRVRSLIKEGFEKEQIFEMMLKTRKVKDVDEPIYPKWSKEDDSYHEFTYRNALRDYQKEKENHLPFLKNPDLMKILDVELGKKIVDENDTRKTILLVALGGSLTANCSPTSTNMMVNDASGAGKDYISQSVLSLIPKFKVVARKRISEKAFTYWHNAKFEPEWTWSGRIFYNEDIGNSLLNCDVFKVMSSSDGVNHSTVIIKQQLVEIITKGKPVMLITVANARPKDELLRRFPICSLNTTEDQTRKIIKRKAQFHKCGSVPGYDDRIVNGLAFLNRVKVKVPFADKLEGALDTSHIIIRTHFDRFMDYIKFSCAIHQYQRKEEGGYLLAERQDYEIASEALLKTTSNIFSVPLTKNQQRILDILRVKPDSCYSVGDLETDVNFISDRTLRIELDKLTEYGFLSKDKEDRADSKKPVMTYHLNKLSRLGLPSWTDIEKSSLDSIESSDSSITIDSIDSIDSNDGTNESNESNELTNHHEEMQIEEEKID